VEQKLRAFELDRHVGEFPLQALELAQRTAELLAGRCMLARLVERITPERQRARGVAEALDVEARHLLLEAAGSKQDVLRRNAAIVEMQFAPLLAAHEARGLPDDKARRAALDDHRADPADARPVAHIDQKNRRIRAEAGKELAAVDDVMGAVGLRAGLEVGRRRAGVGLADAEAYHNASPQQVGQPARLLLRRSIFGEGADRSEIAELHHVGAARADGGDLLDGDHRVHERAALAAVGFGQADAPETGGTHQFRDVERIARVVRALERIFFEVRERETANRVGEGLLLFGEVELHLGFPQTGRAVLLLASQRTVRASLPLIPAHSAGLRTRANALMLGTQSSISHPGPRYGVPATHSASLRAFTPVHSPRRRA